MEKNLEDDDGEILGVHSQGDCGNVTTDDNEDVTPSDSSWIDYIGPLTSDEIDSDKRWSYRDPNGNIHGLFSLAQLRCGKIYILAIFRFGVIIGTVKEAILLHNALSRQTKDAGTESRFNIDHKIRDVTRCSMKLDIVENLQVVQIVQWYLDSGCSKHMTENRSQLINFVSKFLGTVRFENDRIAKIMGYRDYQMENVTISRVYYMEGLGHNLFSVGQFCDSDLEVAFRKHTCFIRDLKGVDLLKGSRGSNLYTLSMENLLLSSPICFLSKALKTNSWLWHRRLSHLNFDYITFLAKQGLVRGLPKVKYQKDHLCSACALGKSKKHSHKPKAEDSIQEKLYLLHMDLYKPMRIQSINGRKYVLVIVDDYSRFTWVKFLRSREMKVPEFVIQFHKMIHVD
ncbi:retrovirus-related pol polyprotein from transposon TNT 1-94 [Tanacetum coccineum]